MSETAISVHQLSKRYRLGATVEDSFREMVYNRIGKLARALRGAGQGSRLNDFWALRNVSFEVKQGECVGIIGRNGAGKSTLLKILSRICDPTEGRARMFGRVGSLLEVGTGFHPELTGRENIYLNGAILGMRHAQIKSRFDEIVAFSEVEQFLDTPVKRYSSGMYVRLAFAVAAHLDPEILIVDEVLAVGDAAFQKKCLGKMETVAKDGRTVLFVSHNMGAVRELCTRGVVLAKGELIADAPAAEAVAKYLAILEENSKTDVAHRTDRRGKGHLRLESVEIKRSDGQGGEMICHGDPVRFSLDLNRPCADLICVLSLYDTSGVAVLDLRNFPVTAGDQVDRSGGSRLVCELDSLALVPGRYRLDVELWAGRELGDKLEGAAYFDVSAGKIDGRLLSKPIRSARVTLPQRWTTPG